MAIVPKAHAATTSLTAAPRVTFTFDDGLQSAVTLAKKTLTDNGITNATAYIITGCIGKTAANHCVAADDNATYMTWAQVAELKAAGWNIGSHTVTHPLLTTVTNAQLKEELAGSKTALAAQGYDAVDLAVPYGDYNNAVLAEAAKYYATLRGFADIGPNVWPYDDRLVLNEQVQEGTTVSADAAASTFETVKAKIDSAITNNQWLTLTFHDVVTAMPTNTNQYATTTSLLGQIAAYVKQQSDAGKISVVSPHDAIVNNTPNMLGDGSFNGALSTDKTQTNVWSTDDTTGTLVKKDAGTNGSYVIGNATSATNAIYMAPSAANAHLFSPRVAVDPAQTYVVKGYVNVTAMTSGEVSFFVDEYNASGYVSTIKYQGIVYSADANAIRVKNVNFAYKPSTTAITSAQVYVMAQGASGIQAYIDNVEMFSPTAGASITPTLPPATTKTGDINGDGAININDLSILSNNWNKTGATASQGDLNGDGAVNINDLSILSSNWGK